MTLISTTGFDLGDTNLRGNISSTFETSTTTPYGVGRSLQVRFSNNYLTWPVTASAELYVGFAFTKTVYTIPFFDILGDNGVTIHGRLAWTGASTLSAYRGSTIIDQATVPWPNSGTGTWYFMEVYFKCDDAAGRFQVKIDGNTVIDFTGDTKNAGTSTDMDTIRLGHLGAVSATTLFDDLYVCNALGSAPDNTFLGVSRVYTLSPTGAGTDTDMTPSAGANWECVDDQPYSTADYVTGAAGDRDTYATADLPASVGTVIGVTEVAVAKRTDAAAISLQNAVRSGGSVYTGSAVSLGASDGVVTTLRTTDPATAAAWTPAGVNAVEIGVEAS